MSLDALASMDVMSLSPGVTATSATLPAESPSSSSSSTSSSPASSYPSLSLVTAEPKSQLSHRHVESSQRTRETSSQSQDQNGNSPKEETADDRGWWICQKYKQYARYMNSRACPGHAYIPTVEEHVANMFTHGVLVLPSVVGMLWMLRLAATDMQHGIAMVYGLSLFVLFSVSTVFHALSYSGKFRSLKNFFHIGDRAVIYIFIAASYTPWLTLKDYDGWGILMLYIVWISAALGIFYQYTFHERYKWLETLLYLVMGVCPSVVCLAMKDSSGMYEMALGGSVYISGVVFFKCDGLIPFAHAIWHCFVTLGAICHYQAVCTYLLGDKNSAPDDLGS